MISLVKFYDNRGLLTYSRPTDEVKPFSQGIKDHFYFGGTALVGGEKIGCHNALAKIIGVTP